MSQHTITADIDVQDATIGVLITFSFLPGRPANTVSAKLVVSGHGITPTQEQIDQWAHEWLANDKNYSAACADAEASQWPDPDYAYESRRDDRE